MEIMIWIGTALSLTGLGAIIWCIVSVAKARNAGFSDTELRERMLKLVPVNGGALALSVLGLILVVAGVFLSG